MLDSKFKHPPKGIKIDRTAEDIVVPVPPKIMEHYKFVHLDLDVLFVNGVAFLLAKSREIGFIHCKQILIKLDKQVMNGLKSIVLDYEAKEFKVITAFPDGAFKPIIH